jgi:hypothetical protein
MGLELIDSGCQGQQLYINKAQGESVSLIIIIPFDITGYDFKSTIDFPIPLTLTVGNGIEITQVSPTGKVRMFLTTNQTDDIVEGQYPFDFWSTTLDVQPFNVELIKGFFNINTAVTKI